MTLQPPYDVVVKPYGRALVELAQRRPDVICLGADLTRQTETDLFRDRIPDRFFNAGMGEQNLIGVASGLARRGKTVFVNTFGVFATRRPYEQIAMQIAYPRLNVKIVGLMPGLSTPGGPSHQATDDIALMSALPHMRVIDVADAHEIEQAVQAIADIDGPVYLRLKRNEIPVLFEAGHKLELDRAVVIDGDEGREVDTSLIASGMMVPAALSAARALRAAGLTVNVVNVTSIKPLDRETIARLARRSGVVVTAENHSVVGGLGTAVATVLATEGIGTVLRMVGIADRFAEAASARYLFKRYGLSSADIVTAAWHGLGRADAPPEVADVEAPQGAYSPV